MQQIWGRHVLDDLSTPETEFSLEKQPKTPLN